MPVTVDAALIDDAVRLAAELQRAAAALQTPAERRQQAELARMLESPADKATLVELTDQAFRSHAAARTAEQFTHILDVQGIPRFFSPLDRALLLGFQTFGDWLPSVTVPMVKSHLRHETANVVLPAEPELLHEHLAARRAQGLRMNLNFLGEALLGEDEARARLAKYAAALAAPDVEVLSVKISTIDSQILPIAREHTLGRLCDRLEPLYRAAARNESMPLPLGEAGRRPGEGAASPSRRSLHPHPDPSPKGRGDEDSQHAGPEGPGGLRARETKFLYLDMEEYRDLALTAEAFMRTLDRPGLARVRAGIALQAYVPDSFRWQRRITEWAQRRVAAGGEPVTIRIVKGANMEMERVDAALHGWPQAPFRTKVETDANYKRMLGYALEPDNLAAARVGIASHNLFDVAWGLVLAERAGAGDRVQFEMLEGMANHQRRALLERTKRLLLYAPACRKEEFLNAIGYLIRRLDENTGPENFLGHAFRLAVGGPDWQLLERGFREAFTAPVSDAPRRTQDRRTETFPEPVPERPWQDLDNEPDTDWALEANSAWAAEIVGRDTDAQAGEIGPVVVEGREAAVRETRPGRAPSRPGAVIRRHAVATDREVDEAVACAAADPDGWRTASCDERSAVLGRVAQELRRARATL
ncbi:MAG: proline dehydrogenase family protein, partial [Planctomycetia bacterium]